MPARAPSASILRFDPWADAVAPGGRLPVPLVGGAAAAVRPQHAYLVGATGPGGTHAAYSLTLKPGRRDDSARRGAVHSHQPVETLTEL